jgi:hypothetical protein
MRDVGVAISLSDAVSKEDFLSMEQHSLKNVNNCLNTNIYSYLETSGGQSSNPYLNVVHFFITRGD